MKREAKTHTKMKRLMRRLDLQMWQAMGLLEAIWHLTATEAFRGDIGKLSDEDIALGIDYRGDERELVNTLIETGWLDRCAKRRLIVHDWHEHADDAVKKRVQRAVEIGEENFYLPVPFVPTCPDNGGQNGKMSGHVPPKRPNVPPKRANGSLPEPEPEPGSLPAPEPSRERDTSNPNRVSVLKTDDTWQHFQQAAAECDMLASDVEIVRLSSVTWPRLSIEQKLLAVEAVKRRKASGEYSNGYTPGMAKFLQYALWTKPDRPKRIDQKPTPEQKRTLIDSEFTRMMAAQEEREKRRRMA